LSLQSLSAGADACAPKPLLKGEASEVPPGNKGLTIVSLNMARETDVGGIITDLTESALLTRGDVWLLQEVVNGHSSNEDAVAELAQTMGLHFVYAPSDADSNGTMSGLAILSRYPLSDVEQIALPRYDLLVRSRCRIGLAATIEADSGPVRLFNVHLDTRINGRDRVEQVAPILNSASTSSVPVIVGGDFNTSNFRWFWNVFPLPFVQNQVTALRGAFTERGFNSPLDGLGATFRVLGMPLSLDWIFPKGLHPVLSGIERIDFSDHRAVWVSLAR
jgi:endonuclease/exonuclease/phosphatase family metal-dependent hydrolase